MKLFVSNADITKQYVQARLFCEAGNVAVAQNCKNILKYYWNQLNSGQVDVESVDHLYTKLCQTVRMITRAQAEAFDLAREQDRGTEFWPEKPDDYDPDWPEGND